MLAFLIAPILVCGIIWIQSDPKEYFKISTYQGWLVYLHAAKFGFVLLTTSYVISEIIISPIINLVIGLTTFKYDFTLLGIISSLINDSLPIDVKSSSNSNAYESASLLIALSIMAICFTYSLTYALRAYWKRTDFKTHYLTSFWEERKILDRFIFQALQNKDLVQITLSSRKCYVGLIAKIQEPNEESTGHQHISLIPVLSGYRDKDKLSLIFSNEYPKIPTRDVINYNDVVIIPTSELVSISGFDLKIYALTADNLDEHDLKERK